MKSLVILLFVAGSISLLFSGCITTAPYTTPIECAGLSGESLIEKNIKDPRQADILLTIANFEGLEAKFYAVKDAEQTLNEIETFLNVQGKTYAMLANYVVKHLEKIELSRRLLLLSMYIDMFQNEARVISPKDVCLLKIHIRNQREKVISLF